MNHLYDPQPEREFTNILSPQDVGFIVGAKQNIEITNKRLAAIESGFFSAPNSDWMKSEEQKLKAAEQIHHVRTKTSSKLGREAQGEALKRLGSSKGAKVRHRKNSITERFATRNRRRRVSHGTISEMGVNHDDDYQAPRKMQSGWVFNPDLSARRLEYVPSNQTRAYLMRREWSNQIKMQLVYHPAPQDAPPTNNGDRYTEKLTSRAVRKIFESGAYVAAAQGGFTTFLTLTFTPEQRDKIFSGEVTLGSEVSRFLDGAKKMYRRGFTAEIRGEKDNNLQRNITLCNEVREVEGRNDGFHYIWVAECPANENGEPNPHVHILLNWQVEKEIFHSWAQRIEKIWGNGFATLEKIKHPKAAGSYLIKAVGYAAKGDNATQGLIRGNRYNIARCSRAPSWDVLAAFDVDNMASIIRECGYKLERWRKPLEKEINRKKFKKDELIKVFAIENKKGEKKKIFKLKSLIKRLETEITEHKEILKSRGAFARSDNIFSITFEGEQAAEKMDNFLHWAAGARRWSMKCDEINMDDIQQNAVLQYSSEYQQFLERRADWQSQLNQMLPPLPNDEEVEIRRQMTMELMEDYEREIRKVA
ncbi:hypothetical protein G6Z92_04775 [Vibrio aestuarianus subsp. cardii]|uniref:rolling circle replication-associated protein n=1 Tax=Vibrio aestuarianus TaxID=28171 RepID=UPI0015C5257D|nr:hypothetical protein [Vibrio aestuarianus]NGZ66301.1 hypothetical protein [Vibrio aestuarianus subsp. cardii]